MTSIYFRFSIFYSSRLLRKPAHLAHHATPAFGRARLAHVAPVQDQPMMRVAEIPGRRRLGELVLDFARGAARGQPGAIADAKDMSIDRDRRFTEGDVEHDVRGLAPDPGQALERGAVAGHLALVLGGEDLRKRDDVFRLGVEEPDGLDVRFQALEAEREHFPGRVGNLEQRPGRLVDA